MFTINNIVLISTNSIKLETYPVLTHLHIILTFLYSKGNIIKERLANFARLAKNGLKKHHPFGFLFT